MEKEEWRQLEEAPAYIVSSRGRLARLHLNWRCEIEPRLLQPGFNRGYARYMLSLDGRHINRAAHVLVCTAFNGPKPEPSLVCAHRDGDKTNNTPNNLYWATQKENADDRERHGRTFRGPMKPEAFAKLPRGDDHYSRRHPHLVRRGDLHWRTGTKGRGAVGDLNGQSKLSEADIRAIMETPKVYGSGRRLAEQYGISFEYVSMIRNGKAWKWLRPLPDKG